MKRGKSKNIIYMAVLMMFLMSFGLGMNVSAEENLVIEGYIAYTVGDYFDYDTGLDDELAELVADDDWYTSYQIVETKQKISVTGSETITIGSNSYECWTLQMDMIEKYKLVGNGVDIDEEISEETISVKAWMGKENFATMKQEGTANMDEVYDYPESSLDEDEYYETEMTMSTTYTEVESAPPFPLKVGKTWSGKNSYTTDVEYKIRSRTGDEPWTDWETMNFDDDVSETTNYEVIAEVEKVVPAGTFNTLKIKDKEAEDDYYYTYSYYNEFGLVIVEEHYDEEYLEESMELKAYKYAEAKDTDGDGKIDSLDEFPNDPDEYRDSDKDGVGDNADVFPNDANETKDTDLDGVGDNADVFPTDADETVDTDSDGVGDNSDVFPIDANETKDTDLDGVGDKADAFPTDSNETLDTDTDGVGDNTDVFPFNASETIDTDSDGIGDNADAFPADAAASLDTDGDGRPDSWNTGKSKLDSTSGLEIDAYPKDVKKWEKEEESGGLSNTMLIIIIVVVVIAVVLAIIMMMMKKKKAAPAPPPPAPAPAAPAQPQYQAQPPAPQYPPQPPQPQYPPQQPQYQSQQPQYPQRNPPSPPPTY